MQFEDLKVGMTVLNLKTNKTAKIVEIFEKTQEVALSNKAVRFWSTHDVTWKVIKPLKVTKKQAEEIEAIKRSASKSFLVEYHKGKLKDGGWYGYTSLNSISAEDMESLLEYGYEVIQEPQNEVEMVEELYGESAVEEMLQPQNQPNCRNSSDVLDSFRYALEETIERKKNEVTFDMMQEGLEVRCIRKGKITVEGLIVSVKPVDEQLVIKDSSGNITVNFKGSGRTWEIIPLDQTNLTEEDDLVLWDMYVDMAIATGDKEWFSKLLGGSINA